MDEDKVRKWLHDLNNRIGMVLANAELMQLEKLTPKALERSKLIEEKRSRCGNWCVISATTFWDKL